MPTVVLASSLRVELVNGLVSSLVSGQKLASKQAVQAVMTKDQGAGTSRSRQGKGVSCASIDVDLTLEKLSKEEKNSAAELFRLVDTDSSGSLAVEELHAARHILGIESNSLIAFEDWLGLVDHVGDGEILANDFAVLLHLIRQGPDSPQLVYLTGHGPPQFSPSSSSPPSSVTRAGKNHRGTTLRGKIWIALEDPTSSRFAGTIGVLLLGTILLSVGVFCVGTIEIVSRDTKSRKTLDYIELTCTAIFSVELLVRITTMPRPWRFLLSPLNVIDVVSLLPFYLELFVSGTQDNAGLRIVRLFRVVRMFKLSRYVTWLRLYGAAFQKASFPLAMALVVCMIYVSLLASLVFFLEDATFDRSLGEYIYPDGSKADLQSVFDGMYFAIISITTVGYGDMRLRSSSSMAVGACGLLCGILIFAIPISIFSTHFQAEYDEFTKVQQRQAQRQREMSRTTSTGRGAIFNRMIDLGFLEKTSYVNEKSSRCRISRLACCGSNTKLCHSNKVSDRGGDSATSKMDAKTKGSPVEALKQGIAQLEQSEITSLRERQKLRKAMLREQMQQVIDQRREQLWATFRVLERKHREKLIAAMLEKYAVWFLRSDEQLEQEIVKAVLKIQAVFRGGMARIVMSTKLATMANRAKRESVLVL